MGPGRVVQIAHCILARNFENGTVAGWWLYKIIYIYIYILLCVKNVYISKFIYRQLKYIKNIMCWFMFYLTIYVRGRWTIRFTTTCIQKKWHATWCSIHKRYRTTWCYLHKMSCYLLLGSEQMLRCMMIHSQEMSRCVRCVAASVFSWNYAEQPLLWHKSFEGDRNFTKSWNDNGRPLIMVENW